MSAVRVHGTPFPQGSKIIRRSRGGRVWLADDNAHRLKAWRDLVASAWTNSGAERVTGAAALDVTFIVPRPGGHYGTGRNSGRLRPSAPAVPAVLPDLDKYLRATMDALTRADAWEDDGRVVSIRAAKVYALRPGREGAIITVTPMSAEEAAALADAALAAALAAELADSALLSDPSEESHP